jgi:hypothetical protein
MPDKAIPQNVIRALAQVRESGAYNMFSRKEVINMIALDLEDWDAAEWLTDNKDRYMDALNEMGAWISRPDFDPAELDEDDPYTVEPIEFSDAHDPMTEAAREIVRQNNTPAAQPTPDIPASRRSRFYTEASTDDTVQDFARRMEVPADVKRVLADTSTSVTLPDDWEPSDELYIYQISWINKHGLEPIPPELDAMFKELCEVDDENKKLRAERDAAIADAEALRAALQPFADAVNEVPFGVRSTLRVWIGDDNYKSLSATTDHLQQAADAIRAASADAGAKGENS